LAPMIHHSLSNVVCEYSKLYWALVGTDATVVAAPAQSPRSVWARPFATNAAYLMLSVPASLPVKNACAESRCVMASLKPSASVTDGPYCGMPLTVSPNVTPLQNDCDMSSSM